MTRPGSIHQITATEPLYSAPYSTEMITGADRAVAAARIAVLKNTVRPIRLAAFASTAPAVTRGKITSATALGISRSASPTGSATAYSATAVDPASTWITGTSILSRPYWARFGR